MFDYSFSVKITVDFFNEPQRRREHRGREKIDEQAANN